MSKQNIEDIYPLSPMQQGMLFHRLYATRTDVYFHQAEFTLRGRLDVGAFERAWERVVSRHPILRSAFIWERGQEPFQVVRQRVKLPLEQHDWRDLSRDERQEALAEFLRADRERGIELFKAPLMRLSLIRMADDVSHLVWSHHHMLLDGWSVALVLKEIFTFYEAFSRGEDLQLERPRPYGDYIAWLQRQDMGKAEEFWRETLRGFAAPTKLGVERATTALHEQEQGYDDLSVALTDEETAALYSFAQQQKLTVNTLVQGAWAVLVSRYSGEEDVVFGAATSGRPVELSGVDSMIGNFINTLPARVRVTPEESTLDWLRQLLKRQAEARQFDYSPLVQIQRWSEIPRGESLFETIVIFENYPVDSSLSESRGGLEIGDPRVDDRTNYPLSLVISVGGRFLLRLIYDRVRYDAETIRRMLGHLKTILLGMVERPSERLSYLPMLTEPERRLMLAEWNDTSAAYDGDRCIHELFEAQAEAQPGAVAVVSEDGQLTYGELNEQANRLARLLRSAGVRRGTLVGVLMHRSANMIPALLAILKAGGAYVPLEPAYPKSRLEWILSSLDLACLVTQSTFLETLGEMRLPALRHVVCLDAPARPEPGDRGAAAEPSAPKKIWTWGDARQFGEENLPAQATAEDLAYIIFTSGSTGTPKGVIVRHQPVINLIDWVNRTFDVNPSDRVLFITSLCFDLSVYDVFGLLAAGGSIRVVTEPDIRDPERLLHMLTTEPITFWDSAPAALQQLVPFFPSTRFPRGNRLRLVFMSGDWVPVTLPELLMRTFPSVEVIALGGATEATVWSNFYPVSEVDPSWPSIPYGKPIQNSRYHIADPFLNPCPVGVAGDLYIAGECLSTGYIDEPALTAEKFIPDPFGQTPGDRLYKTGDRARYLAGGDIEFLGRVDNQVKIRGFRVELGEIEAALAQHPGLRAAVVVAREDVPKEKHLVAYLVPDEERAPTIGNLLRLEEAGELDGHQQQELPNGMVIAYRNRNETDFMYKKIFEDEVLPAPPHPARTGRLRLRRGGQHRPLLAVRRARVQGRAHLRLRAAAAPLRHAAPQHSTARAGREALAVRPRQRDEDGGVHLLPPRHAHLGTLRRRRRGARHRQILPPQPARRARRRAAALRRPTRRTARGTPGERTHRLPVENTLRRDPRARRRADRSAENQRREERAGRARGHRGGRLAKDSPDSRRSPRHRRPPGADHADARRPGVLADRRAGGVAEGHRTLQHFRRAARRAPGGAAAGRRRARARRPRAATERLGQPEPPDRRRAGFLEGESARVHGALRLRAASRAAVDFQRQG